MSFSSNENNGETDNKYSNHFKKPVTDKGDLEEINKINEMLNPDRKYYLLQDNQK
jgi:hypothetical protein